MTLPADITGQYYITAWADSLNQVLKSEQSGNTNPDDPNTLDNDNFKARPITVLQTAAARPGGHARSSRRRRP